MALAVPGHGNASVLPADTRKLLAVLSPFVDQKLRPGELIAAGYNPASNAIRGNVGTDTGVTLPDHEESGLPIGSCSRVLLSTLQQ